MSARVQLRRGSMHYLEAGSGMPAVLLHGWPGHAGDYEAVLDKAAAFARVIAPDFLGFGYSDPVPTVESSAADEEALAADIVDLLDELQLDRVVLGGYDIGSAVAPAVARAAPARVEALLLMNPTHPLIGEKASTPTMIAESWYQHFHALQLSTDLLDGNPEALRHYLAHFYDHWGGSAKIGPEHFERTWRLYSRPGAFSSSVRWYPARIARRLGPAVATPPLGLRTVALWGDRDPMRPLEHREGFDVAFPSSESEILEGVGHFVPFEAPDAVVAALRRLVEASRR